MSSQRDDAPISACGKGIFPDRRHQTLEKTALRACSSYHFLAPLSLSFQSWQIVSTRRQVASVKPIDADRNKPIGSKHRGDDRGKLDKESGCDICLRSMPMKAQRADKRGITRTEPPYDEAHRAADLLKTSRRLDLARSTSF